MEDLGFDDDCVCRLLLGALLMLGEGLGFDDDCVCRLLLGPLLMLVEGLGFDDFVSDCLLAEGKDFVVSFVFVSSSVLFVFVFVSDERFDFGFDDFSENRIFSDFDSASL